MIEIYGAVASRAARNLWMLEELGLEYELKEVSPGSEASKHADYLRINPNGKVPAMVDGETVLWESMAINLYLAEKYGGLKPQSPEDWGRACQWSFWGMLEAEAHLQNFLFHSVLLPEEKRKPDKVQTALTTLQKPLGVLNEALAGRDYLLDSGFSVADLNLAAIFSWGKMARLDLSAYPNLRSWLNACLERDAYRRVFPRKK